MGEQPLLIDIGKETRPLRKVLHWRHVSRWKSEPLLECGHAGHAVSGSKKLPERQRCGLCAAYGADEDGLKYRIPEVAT